MTEGDGDEIASVYPDLRRLFEESNLVPWDDAAMCSAMGGFRSQLLAGVPTDAVANALSRLVANINIASLIPQFSPDIARIVRETQAPYLGSLELSQAGLGFRDSVVQAINPAAIAASIDFTRTFDVIGKLGERMAKSAELSKAYDQALWEMGWWVPPSLLMDDFWRIGGLAHAGDRRGVRREMLALGRHRDMFGLVREWSRLEPFRRRERFILDGLRDHRRGRFRVSIPTLLPLIEGIAFDVFATKKNSSKLVPVVSDALAVDDLVIGTALVQTVSILWVHQDFAVVPSGSRRLNRHLVLHGRSLGYGTEENSVKVLFALDQLASVVERWDQREVAA